MATLLQDAFTDSNGTSLSSHVMTGTPAKAWSQHGVVAWKITANAASDTFASSHSVASADATKSDVVLTLDIAVPSATDYSLGANVRLTNGSNFWICGVKRDSSGTPYLHITEYNGAAATLRASVNIPAATGTTVSITVTTSGNSITILANTSETCNYASATFNNTATRHGLYMTTNGGYVGGPLDNFLVTGSLGLEDGKIPKFGFGAGAIKYTVLEGFSPNPGSVSLNPRIPTLGFGINGVPRMMLLGFSPNPAGPGGIANPRIPTLGFGLNGVPRMTLLGFTPNPGGGGGGGLGAFYIFGGSIVR